MKSETRKIGAEDLVRILTLQTNPQPNLLSSVFENLPASEPSSERRQQTLERLRKALSTEVTFGELVSRGLSEKKLDLSILALQVGIPEQTIESLAKDTIFPFTVPVVLMKRFIEHLGFELDAARQSMALTAATLADSMFEDHDLSIKLGVSARRSYQISMAGVEPKVMRDRSSVLHSSERYLERLEQLINEG